MLVIGSAEASVLPPLPGFERIPALDEAARIHGEEVLADAKAASRSDLDRALIRAGVSDPDVTPFAAIDGSPRSLSDALSLFVRERIADRGITHYGAAYIERDGRRGLFVLFSRRLLDLPALPRRVDSPALHVGGRLLHTGRLRLFMTTPDGAVIGVPAQRRGAKFEAEIRFERGAGPYTFEAVVHTERGPEVAALWRFAARTDARPRRPSPGRRRPNTRAAAQALIKKIRRKRGLPRAKRSEALSRAASFHAKQVCRTLTAAHVLEGRTPTDRARTQGHRGAVTENVAIADSVAKAHRNFLDSPSHRRNIIDPRVRRFGVGVASRRAAEGLRTGDNPRARTWCLVQVFGLAPDQP